MAEEALRVVEKTYGPNNSRVATTLNNQAIAYRAQGRYALAESLYNRALETYEKTLGRDHHDTAVVCEDMAKLYRQIGKED